MADLWGPAIVVKGLHGPFQGASRDLPAEYRETMPNIGSVVFIKAFQSRGNTLTRRKQSP
jgi:hypothetical protein